MKRNCALLLILIGCRTLLPRDLKQAIDLALQNNPAIHALEQQVAAAGHLVEFRQRRTLPGLQAKAGYRYQSEVMELDLAGLPHLPVNNITLGAKDTWETGITLSWVVFSGYARRAGIRKSRAQGELVRVQLKKTQKEMALQTATGYRTVQGLRLHIQSLQAAIRRAELQEKKIGSLVENGMALGVDTLSIALATLNYQQQLLTVEAQHQTAMQKLEHLTGTAIKVSDYTSHDVYQPGPFLSGRAEALKILATQIEIHQQEKIQARSKYYPTITVHASENYGKPGVDYIRNEWMSYAVVGANLQWDIWNWGATKAATQAGAASVRQTRHELENTRKKLQLLYDTSVREYQTMQKQLSVLQKSLTVAKEKMHIIKLLSDQGMVTATEFNDTNLELTQAEIAWQQQLVELAGKIHELDYKSGRPVEAWYVE